jgi:hypothetical protein
MRDKRTREHENSGTGNTLYTYEDLIKPSNPTSKGGGVPIKGANHHQWSELLLPFREKVHLQVSVLRPRISLSRGPFFVPHSSACTAGLGLLHYQAYLVS